DHVADADGIGLSVNTWARNIDVVSAGGEILTGDITHCDVLIAGHDINQRTAATDGRVAPTGCEAIQRGVPDGRVAVAVTIAGVDGCEAGKGCIPYGRIEVADCVAIERKRTIGYIPAAGCVGKECLIASSHIVVAAVAGVAKERLKTGGRVEALRSVAKKRERSIGCVLRAGTVA